MKKFFKICIGSIALLAIAYVFFCTSFPFSPDKTKCMNDGDRLTTTHWKQMGGFQKFTPDSLRTGCWSTALAQIVYFHKLKPFGHIEYISRQGYRINETMDSSQFNFATFTQVIDSTTSTESIDQLAKYNYYAALAVQKDFGTDRYMNKLAPASLLEEHYNMKVERFIAWHNSYRTHSVNSKRSSIKN